MFTLIALQPTLGQAKLRCRLHPAAVTFLRLLSLDLQIQESTSATEQVYGREAIPQALGEAKLQHQTLGLKVGARPLRLAQFTYSCQTLATRFTSN